MTTTDRPQWRTPSYSNAGEACVEVARVPDPVLVRRSKRPHAGMIEFTLPAWAAFVGETVEDRPSANGVVTVTKNGTDTLVRSLRTGVALLFDDGEWTAFLAGARDGEFDFSSGLIPAAR